MNIHTSRNLLYLFLLGALLLWLGCDPEDDNPPINSCEDNVPSLVYGDYCLPNLLDLRGLQNAANEGADLPDFCATNYQQSRTVKVSVPSSGLVYFHLYLNFPGKVSLEFIGADCEGGFTQLNGCNETSEAVVKTFSIAATGYQTLYIRMRYEGNDGYVPGQREIDRLTVAAFNAAPVFGQLNGQTEGAVSLGCGSYTNRLILTPGSGNSNPLRTAILSGLPYQVCDCSEGQLVTITAPVGVDINTGVRPKIKEKDTAVDTVQTTVDFVIRAPSLSFQDQPDPDTIEEIRENGCLDFAPNQQGQNNKDGVKVTIVDSGVDINTHGGLFSAYNIVSNTPDCIPFGDFGADLVNADATPNDEIGHGTAVASTLLSGFRSESTLNLIHNKFFGPEGGTLFDALCASYAGLQAGTDLLNFSWGFESQEEPAALIALVKQAEQKNVIIVSSAGNLGQNLDGGFFNYWPAAAGGLYENVITVGSFQRGISSPPTTTYWTNFGSHTPQIAAFYTANALRLNSLTTHYPVGTSISAPIVSRKLAEIKGNSPSLSATEVIQTFLTQQGLANTNFSGRTRNSLYLPVPSPNNNCQ